MEKKKKKKPKSHCLVTPAFSPVLSEDLLLATFLQKSLKILSIPATFVLLLLVCTVGIPNYLLLNLQFPNKGSVFLHHN